MNSYLPSVLKQFEYYKSLGDKTIAQLSFSQLKLKLEKDSNSIAIITSHLAGNMRSRWTNFLTEDGEKSWRHRDKEFLDSYETKEDLVLNWDEGWSCLFEAIKSLNYKDLNSIIYIRNEGHTVTEAINRQLMHYAYHVGQIVLLGKLIKGNEWKSISIPKGTSEDYNSVKFSKPKGKQHFTDNL